MVAYNKGQAVQLLAKKLKADNRVLSRDDPVVEIKTDKPFVIEWDPTG